MARPQNSGAVPPDMGIPMATEPEHKHHFDTWKILKNQNDSFINISHELCAAPDKVIPDQF